MQASFAKWVSQANEVLGSMGSARTNEAKLTHAMTLANHVLGLITGEQLRNPLDIIGEHILTLQNSERYDAWFQHHPDFEGTRAVFDIFEGTKPGLQAKLYWLKKRSNALMAGAVHFTPNWEDAEWSRNDNYKLGIDFFLSPAGDAVHIALSNLGKLRVLELEGRLTNTDIEILQKWAEISSVATKNELHTAIWDSFKLHSVNARFYAGIAAAFADLHEHLVSSGKSDKDAKMFSSRLLGRLIFVWFMRKMRLVNPHIDYFEASGLNQDEYYSSSLERLFFRTFNTPVNERTAEIDGSIDTETPYLSGGLFEPRSDDWVGETLTFPDEFFTNIFNHFSDFNFTTDESTPDYEQVAIDPEMLGRVFESLLATQIESTGEQARKAKGAFYTPREVVAYMCLGALKKYLMDSEKQDASWELAVSKLLDTSDQEWAKASSNNLATIPIAMRKKIEKRLEDLKTMDPACGSGAFPLGMLHLLFNLRLRLDPNLDTYALKLSILQNNIFGADIEPMAVEISRLRSWLSLVVEDRESKEVQPLPNLEFNFVAANSLIALEGESLLADKNLQTSLANLRDSYFAANLAATKSRLQQEYERLIRPDLFDGFDERSMQLKSFDPFSLQSVSKFFDAEHLFGISDGFDIVIGNPPYLGEKGHGQIFAPVRNSPLGRRFYVGKMDYFYFFFHLGLDLLKPGGALCYITTNYYLTATYANKLRDDLFRRSSPSLFLNFSELKIFESAAGQHNLITLLVKGTPSGSAKTVIAKGGITARANSERLQAVFREDVEYVSVQDIPVTELYSSGQIRLTNAGSHEIESVLNVVSSQSHSVGIHFNVLTGAQTQADRVSKAHSKKFGLPESRIGEGIFVISKAELEDLDLDRHELEIVKPWFKNSDIKKFHANTENEEYVLFADKRQNSLDTRPKVAAHLEKFRTIIDAASSNSPYMHRPRSIDFDAPKIVTPYKTHEVRFAMASGPWYASGDVYFIVSKTGEISLWSLLGILNSELMQAWFWYRGKRKGNLIEMYEEPLSATPIPHLTEANRKLFLDIGDVAEKLTTMAPPSGDSSKIELEDKLNTLVVKLYGLTTEGVTILSSWHKDWSGSAHEGSSNEYDTEASD